MINLLMFVTFVILLGTSSLLLVTTETIVNAIIIKPLLRTLLRVKSRTMMKNNKIAIKTISCKKRFF